MRTAISSHPEGRPPPSSLVPISAFREMFRRTQQLYASAIIRGQAAGEFKEGDEQAKARFLVGHIQGMRVLGKTGVSRADMIALVDTALIILS